MLERSIVCNNCQLLTSVCDYATLSHNVGVCYLNKTRNPPYSYACPIVRFIDIWCNYLNSLFMISIWFALIKFELKTYLFLLYRNQEKVQRLGQQMVLSHYSNYICCRSWLHEFVLNFANVISFKYLLTSNIYFYYDILLSLHFVNIISEINQSSLVIYI